MSAKNLDNHNRWRSVTVAFRMSPEENQKLNEMVYLSGLTKQDYITKKLLNRDVIVHGNPRVFKHLKAKMDEIIARLNTLSTAADISDAMLDTIESITAIYIGIINEGSCD